MQSTPWTDDDLLSQLLEEYFPYPHCNRNNHDEHWDDPSLTPVETRESMTSHGLYESRTCTRCGQSQYRVHVPEDDEDLQILLHRLDAFTNRPDDFDKDERLLLTAIFGSTHE